MGTGCSATALQSVLRAHIGVTRGSEYTSVTCAIDFPIAFRTCLGSATSGSSLNEHALEAAELM